jgi:hypothetical protein
MDSRLLVFALLCFNLLIKMKFLSIYTYSLQIKTLQ